MRLIYLPLLIFCLLPLVIGCSGGGALDTAEVTGTVTYNGKPLPYGSVSFRPKAGSPATGKIQSDGSFTMTTYNNGDGAIVGTHEVLIIATEVDAGTAPEVQPGTEMKVAQSVIPEKYTSFSTSGLTAEVVAGEENQFTFALKD